MSNYHTKLMNLQKKMCGLLFSLMQKEEGLQQPEKELKDELVSFVADKIEINHLRPAFRLQECLYLVQSPWL